MKTHQFYVNGMHCKACCLLIETELDSCNEIKSAKAFLKNNTLEVVGDFGDKTLEHIAIDLTEILKEHGYTVSAKKQKHKVIWSDFKIALPISLAFILFFIFLQKIGIVNLINSSSVDYSTAFIIGFVASISTCMVVVGGLVLSMSASFSKEGDKVKPQILFHLGRLVSFFVLGGVIGMVGSSFQLSGVGTSILSFIVAIVLLILGINLLDVLPSFKKIQLTLPNFIGKKVHDLKNLNHTLTPLLLGIVTFFLPCGFTQSMQIYALSTGSFVTGAMTMLFFALGTLPVLSILSFGFLGIHKKAQSGIFFKTAGIVVIFFGLVNLVSSLIVIGLLPPIFNF